MVGRLRIHDLSDNIKYDVEVILEALESKAKRLGELFDEAGHLQVNGS